MIEKREKGHKGKGHKGHFATIKNAKMHEESEEYAKRI